MKYISLATFCHQHDVSVGAMCHHLVSRRYVIVTVKPWKIIEFSRSFFILPGTDKYARFPDGISDLCLTQAGCERLRQDIAWGLS